MIVAIDLSHNGLTAPQLPTGVLQLEHLESLVLRNNSIRGALPVTQLSPRLSTLDLRDNRLRYPPPANVRRACLDGRVSCAGYPPISCSAFGPDYVVAADSSTRCVQCGERLLSIMALCGLTAVLLLGVGTYVQLTHGRPPPWRGHVR